MIQHYIIRLKRRKFTIIELYLCVILSNLTIFHLSLKRPCSKRPTRQVIETKIFVLPRWQSGQRSDRLLLKEWVPEVMNSSQAEAEVQLKYSESPCGVWVSLFFTIGNICQFDSYCNICTHDRQINTRQILLLFSLFFFCVWHFNYLIS